MSNSTATQASLFGADDVLGVVRQKTSAKVIVHSHIEATPPINGGSSGVVDCSPDVSSVTTAKSIKGVGTATISLLPRSNYINYIFPDDWINIWVNPGDGRGYIRIFFGFVDRIERSIETDADTGATSTMFTLSCSDFTKAFEMTHVYFNPYIADREDFVGNFAGTKNLAGAQLRTKGVTAYGSPADIVLSYAHLLMGFGAQFLAPKSYPFNQALLEESRKFRREWAKSRLSKEVLKQIGTSTITQWFTKLKADAAPLAEALRKGEVDEKTQALMDIAFTAKEQADFRAQFASGAGAGKVIDQMAITFQLRTTGLYGDLINDPEIKAGLAIEETATGPGHLLDLIDFSLVEHSAIDGSIVSAPIWTQQGPLWSLMNSYSNNMVNELFADLRPLSEHYKSAAIAKGGYARIPDEGLGDEKDFGVRFVPSLIMREYPFSTISGVNADKATVLDKPVGQVDFGAIFSQEPNIPGRKIVSLTTINDYTFAKNPEAFCYKHLDVSVISVMDIISENIGRSDVDVVNLLEIYSDGTIGKHMKYAMRDIQPISIPISVARHGLRVRTYTTRFARFSKKSHSKAGVDNVGTRRKLVRWAMMLDHWYQHNAEYLNGTITTRAFPEIRVGNRLDIAERNESYYVEGVSHTWTFPQPMTTSLTLSRGQRNDPFPVYEKVPLTTFGGNRKEASRLADMFRQKDPTAVIRAVRNQQYAKDQIDFAGSDVQGNIVDTPGAVAGGIYPNSYIAADPSAPHDGIVAEAFQELESLGDLFDPVTAEMYLTRTIGATDHILDQLRVGQRSKILKAKTGATALRGTASGIKK